MGGRARELRTAEPAGTRRGRRTLGKCAHLDRPAALAQQPAERLRADIADPVGVQPQDARLEKAPHGKQAAHQPADARVGELRKILLAADVECDARARLEPLNSARAHRRGVERLAHAAELEQDVA